MCPELKIPACPDHQVISLYLDGELPSPWKEKLEAHLEICQECRAVLARYNGIGEYLADVSGDTIKAAQERVWKKLTAPEIVVLENTGPGIYKTHGNRISSRRQNVWNRTITLPLPAAAAVVVIVIAFFALLGIKEKTGILSRDSMAVIPDRLQVVGNEHVMVPITGMVPTTDMSGVLQYLSGMDNGDFMVIRLPESKSFSRAGEPALINAADYSRRRLSP